MSDRPYAEMCKCGHEKYYHHTDYTLGPALLSCYARSTRGRCGCIDFAASETQPAWRSDSNGISLGDAPDTDSGPAQHTEADAPTDLLDEGLARTTRTDETDLEESWSRLPSGRGSVPLGAQEANLRDTWEIAGKNEEIAKLKAELADAVARRDIAYRNLAVERGGYEEEIARLEQERDDLKKVRNDETRADLILLERLTEVERERDELEHKHARTEERLQDFVSGYNRIVQEECAKPGEPHCTCVPELRQEIATLRESRAQFERDLTAQMDREYGERITTLTRERDAARMQVHELQISAIRTAATLRNRTEDAEAQAQAWSERIDALVAREQEARWLIENCPCDGPDRKGYLPRRAAWLKGVDAPKEADRET